MYDLVFRDNRPAKLFKGRWRPWKDPTLRLQQGIAPVCPLQATHHRATEPKSKNPPDSSPNLGSVFFPANISDPPGLGSRPFFGPMAKFVESMIAFLVRGVLGFPTDIAAKAKLFLRLLSGNTATSIFSRIVLSILACPDDAVRILMALVASHHGVSRILFKILRLSHGDLTAAEAEAEEGYWVYQDSTYDGSSIWITYVCGADSCFAQRVFTLRTRGTVALLNFETHKH